MDQRQVALAIAAVIGLTIYPGPAVFLSGFVQGICTGSSHTVCSTVVIQLNVALPLLGPCAGNRIAVLMTAFLIERIIILILLALDQVEVTITESFLVDLLICFICNPDTQLPIFFLSIVEPHLELVEATSLGL